MSEISLKLWQSTFGEKLPMPENCTYEQFIAIWDEVSREENRQGSTDFIKKLVKEKRNSDSPFKREAYDELIKSEMKYLRTL